MNGIESNPYAGENANEPMDLADAFSRIVKANAAAAQGDVEAPEQNAGEPEPAGEAAAPSEPETASVGEATGEDVLGGSPDVLEPIDYNTHRKAILDRIQREALNDVRKLFSDEGIQLVSIDKLYQRDEQTGRVTFQNPDDPRNPFTSRAEAQQWVESMNKQINAKFRMDVNQRQQELLNEYLPQLKVLDFKPTYDAMDQVTREIFDDLVDQYSVTDRSGRVVGFNVDLSSVAKQAAKIAKRFSNQAQQAQQQEEPKDQKAQGSKPALDMKSGKSISNDEQEPKTIGEALKMFDKKNGRK